MTEVEQLRVVAKAAADLEKQFAYACGVLEGFAQMKGKVGETATIALDRIKKMGKVDYGPK